jgi:predicted DNA-binding transcriptional regulator AlpA
MPLNRILRIKEVEHVTGLSRATIYRKMAVGAFPASVRLATQTVGWRELDIEGWIDSLSTETSPEGSVAVMPVLEMQ